MSRTDQLAKSRSIRTGRSCAVWMAMQSCCFYRPWLPTLWLVWMMVGVRLIENSAVLFAQSSASIAANDQLSASEKIDKAVNQSIERGEMAGAVVLIQHKGTTLHFAAYGHRQVEPIVAPMELDTIFDLASLTKPIATATSVMILAQRGQLQLDRPVAEYIPEFAQQNKQSIRVVDLMIHTSGLIPDNAMRDYEGSHRDMIDRVYALDLNYPTGSDFKYSDVGFIVLGELVHKVSGDRLDRFAKDHLFGPLQMMETQFNPPAELRVRCATTERRQGKWIRGEVHDPRAYALGGVAGHAGLFSTAIDLSKYAQMVVDGHKERSSTILHKSWIDEMIRDRATPKGIRGLGWDKQSGYSSNRGQGMSSLSIGHGGFTGTGLWIDPDRELIVIFLSNRLHPDGKGNVNPLIGQIGTIAVEKVTQLERP